MASSPPGSPDERSPRPASGLKRHSTTSSRVSLTSRAGGLNKASEDDTKTSVKVVVRVRPPLQPIDPGYDLIPQRFQRSMLQVTSPTNLVIDSPQGRRLFTFDRVFQEDVTQAGVWEYLVDSMNTFVQGYNVSMLAYGQSGAGKSYTMGTSGPNEQSCKDAMGVIPRAATALFEKLRSAKPSNRHSMPTLRSPARNANTFSNSKNSDQYWTLKASYVEIYNEQLRDLLVPESTPTSERPNVTIREDVKGHILLTGLCQVEVNSVEDILSALNFGSTIRQTDSTAINAKSSRSHAVFSLNLVQHKSRCSASHSNPDKTAPAPLEDDTVVTIDSKFHFVDLAGSERLKNTGAQGERAKEGISINAGLASLGKVISQLSSRQAGSHVSYRDSKLTRLLQDSLGGNAVTYMIACITPVEFHLSETLNTVQYAQRARAIQSKPRIQNVSDETDKTALIKRLKAEVVFLRDQIRNSEHGGGRMGDTSAMERSERRPNEREIELQNQLLDIQENYNALSQRHAKVISEMAKARDKEFSASNSNTINNNSGDDDASERLKRSNSFAEAVEHVVMEYESTIQSLEQSLSSARGSLSNVESLLLEKETKCSFIETLNQQLQTRLQKLVDRESSTENYLHDLESKLDNHTSGEEKNSAIVNELRKEIARVRENEAVCEDYISNLEERLAEADQDSELMQREIDRLEHVVERQRSLGKLDCILYELDHIHKNEKNGEEVLSTNDQAWGNNPALHTPDESQPSLNNNKLSNNDDHKDDEFAVSDSNIRIELEGLGDFGDTNDLLGSNNFQSVRKETNPSSNNIAQYKFVEDKLENVSQELFDLRVEHESAMNEYDLLSAKYEEALRTLAQLQDTVDESRHPDFRNSIISEPGDVNPAISIEVKLHDIKSQNNQNQSFSRSLSSELISAGEYPNSLTEHLEEECANGEISLKELDKLKFFAAEREKSHQILAEKFMQLEKEHDCALELVEQLKSEVSKAKTNRSDSLHSTTSLIRRKSSQNVMIIDKAHRAFASLRNIGSENFENNPDMMASFELNLNTAMHELHVRSERVQELEADITAAKKEIESKMTIISGLTRERSSLQSSPIDISVVSSMREQLLERENQIKEAHQIREQELLAELESAHASLSAYTSSNLVNKDIHSADDQGENLQKKITELETELANWQGKHDATLVTFNETEKNLLTTIADLESQISKIGDGSQTIDINDRDDLCAKLQREIAECKASLEFNTSRVAELEKSHAVAQEKLAESTTSRDKALEEIEHHKFLLQRLEQQIAEHDRTVETLQSDLDKLHENHEREIKECKLSIQTGYEARLSELETAHQAKVIELKSNLAEAYEKLNSIAIQVVHATGVEMGIDELQNRLSDILDERKILQEDSKKSHVLKGEITELVARNNDLVRELDMIKSDLSSMLEENTDSSRSQGPCFSVSDQLAALRKEIIELATKNEKNSRLVQELEDQLASNYDQHQVFNNRLSTLQSEHSAQIEETNVVNARVRAELEAVKEEYLTLQAKYEEVSNLDSTSKLSSQAGHLKKSPSVTSLPSPPPAIPLPPLPAAAAASASASSSSAHRSVSPIPGQAQTNRPSSKELAAQQIHEDQEARIRTIEKHLSAEKQLTQTLEEALTDLEKQSKKLRSDSEIWKKRCAELEVEVKELKERERFNKLDKENRWSMLQVEEERKKRRDAEIARAQLEERMNAISKKKKKITKSGFSQKFLTKT